MKGEREVGKPSVGESSGKPPSPCPERYLDKVTSMCDALYDDPAVRAVVLEDAKVKGTLKQIAKGILRLPQPVDAKLHMERMQRQANACESEDE